MNKKIYTNVPNEPSFVGTDATIQAMNNFYTTPLEIKATVFDSMVGYFTNRGFERIAAESISVAIINQSKIDKFNPLTVLDTMKQLSGSEFNGLIAEILNYNRYKTSFLGYTNQFSPTAEVSRNIIP